MKRFYQKILKTGKNNLKQATSKYDLLYYSTMSH